MKLEQSLFTLFLLPVAAALSACAAEPRDFGASSGGGEGGTSSAAGIPAGSGGSGGACSSNDDCTGGPNGKPLCEGGTCTLSCDPGFDDCKPGPDGCETPVDADSQNCGACGVTCALGCAAGACNDPVEIATGFRHTCARLTDGSVYCWGGNESGELGAKDPPKASTPVKVDLPGPAVQITAGGGSVGNYSGGHSCAVMKDGLVQCWGNNDHRQLGLGVNGFNDPLPQPVVGLANAAYVAAGGGHTCAVKKSGELLCWGANNFGQIGNNSEDDVLEPTVVLTEVAKVALGLQHTCAIRTDGVLLCWGNNYANMIGTTQANNKVPNFVQTPPAKVDEVSLGKEHTCARSGNELFCWGADYQSQTGLGDYTTVTAPKTVPVADVRSIELGNVFTGAISGDDGKVLTWGHGPLANADSNGSTPKPNGMTDVASLSLGGDYGEAGFACALKKTHEVVCWGADTYGQLGDGPDDTDKPLPVPVLWK